MAEEAKKKVSALEELDSIQSEYDEQIAAIKIAAAKSGRDGYDLELYSPIMVGAEKRARLHFRPQTVRDMREVEALAKAGPNTDLDELLTARLTGLEVEQVQQLDWLDYASCQAAIVGFQLRRASGGPARKA